MKLCRDPRCSPRGNPACRGTFGGRRKAVRDRFATGARFEEESVHSVCCPWRLSPPGWRRGSGHCGWSGHRSLNGSYPDLDICSCHCPTLLEEPGADVFSLFTPLHLIHQQFLGPSPPDASKPPRCLHLLLLPSLFRPRSPGPNHSVKMSSKFHKTTSECRQRTSGTQKSNPTLGK